MPFFLTREQVYRLIQRELPEGVYPDGNPSTFYSTADSDSIARVFATAYENLEKIYDNSFPQTSDELIATWELVIYGFYGDASLSLATRRANLLKKIQSQNGISKPGMIAVVKSVIGTDKEVDIAEWGSKDGAWVLDESQLDIGTILSEFHLLDATGIEAGCSDGSEFGIDPATFLAMREQAYTYEVLIYNYTLSQDEEDAIDAALDRAEPARSTHVITSGLTDADKLDGDT